MTSATYNSMMLINKSFLFIENTENSTLMFIITFYWKNFASTDFDFECTSVMCLWRPLVVNKNFPQK